ncbi:hypothetical protein F5B22DRAFT_451557 [Xylaria bambusicola]|uniref:uncharacterized protein n=1 Tax=Xylaria bambusicola TaxID=326684 RepID=UPI00200809F0|nr:uncharacterized protein F5B22DRAFT_451557 [Xylaria bambusicola]KAI0506379.1 hypothetical protein F5B22DRAFT_451557 [Xylaria bambusicola]
MDQEHHAAMSQSSTVQLLLWFIFVVSVLTVAARLGTKYALTRRLGWDDYIMLTAQVAYLAQCISISIGVADDLGVPAREISDAAIDTFLKAEYASIVFYIISLALIKCSISAFIRQLSRSTTHRNLDWALQGTIGLWVLTSVLVSLFQCALPTPWDYFHGVGCVDRRAWWTYVAILNILTDIFTVALYAFIIGRLQIPRSKKIIVLSIFFVRLLVVGISAAQLAVFLELFSYSDPTGSLWIPIILNQTTLVISTITACAPYLRPFMESLESNVNRVESIHGSEEELSRDRNEAGTYGLENTVSSVACSYRASR